MSFQQLYILLLIFITLFLTWFLLGGTVKKFPPVFDQDTVEDTKVPGGKIHLSEDEWKKRLTEEQFYILRKGGTEPPYTGDILNIKEKGIYHCQACDLPLFSSDAKYDSGTGWPSFYEPINPDYIIEKDDYYLLFVKRVEVLCARCNSHLGHVFDDGPPPTFKRYCINSIALRFQPAKK